MKRTAINGARQLRRLPTDAEKLFWQSVRNRQIAGAKFRRQWPIDQFIVDFVCLEAKLIVEIDGGQHADNLQDLRRTKILTGTGFRVIRFWNHDVLQNKAGVLEALMSALANAPHPGPLPEGERG